MGHTMIGRANWVLGLCAATVMALGCSSETPNARGVTGGNGAAGAAGTAGGGLDGQPSTPRLQPTAGEFAPSAGAGGQALGTAGSAGGVSVAGGDVPCNVAQVVADNCHTCHGPTPVGGAIQLLTHADWHRTSPLYDPTKQVYQVAQIRINNGQMPQGKQMAAGDLAVLNDWLAGGALAAPAEDPTCAGTTMPPEAGAGGTTVVDPVDPVDPPVGPGGTIDNCTKPGAFDPPVARPGETCHDFPVHAPGGNGKFTVAPGESYHEWYYDVPWGPTDVWTHYGSAFDNLAVLHHYLIFTSSAGHRAGDVAQNVTGTTLGTNATLIGGWAVGGCNTEMPENVAGEIPESPLIMVQWHMYNTTGAPAPEGSVVKVCTVPAGTRPNTAGITFLGTENFNSILGMGPGENHFTTRCTNNSGAPITVIGFNPHMHLIGTHMKTDLISPSGTTTIFDQPFQFDYQVGYEIPPATVMPGDTLESTCSFFNDTGANVAFGESTNQEMCYQFALSYPAGALDNAAPSLIGALNTCW